MHNLEGCQTREIQIEVTVTTKNFARQRQGSKRSCCFEGDTSAGSICRVDWQLTGVIHRSNHELITASIEVRVDDQTREKLLESGTTRNTDLQQ